MDIDKIEIENNDLSFVIFPKKEEVLVEDTTRSIKTEKINELLSIIRGWNNNYYKSGIDGIRFSIRIYSDNDVEVIRGSRDLPNNYLEFSQFVEDVYYGRND